MVKVISPRDPVDENAINVTSRSNNWSRGLSPFFLGPVKLYGKYTAKNVENGYQFLKVYRNYVDENGNPSKEYFEWAEYGWNKERAERYPMGKGSIPLYLYWDGKKYDYVTGKKEVYIPLYRDAVKDTNEYKVLKAFYKNNGNNLVLWDFDAYDHRALGMTWEQVINSPTKKFGHGMVLAMMLEGYI